MGSVDGQDILSLSSG